MRWSRKSWLARPGKAEVLKRFVHILWQRLPRGGRRWLFIRLTAAVAPRPRRPAGAGTPVIVAGVLRCRTGLGESARMNLEGLRQAGLPFGSIDLSRSLLGSPDREEPYAAGTAPTAGPGSLILHASGPFLPYALRCCGAEVVRGKRVIGFLHWELPRLPAEWTVAFRSVHEIWVPSRFCAEAVRQDYDGTVRVIPHPVDVLGVEKRAAASAPFTVLSMLNLASGFERKNPLAAVRAFKLAFGGDPSARLVVKLLNEQSYGDGMAALRREAAGQDNIVLLSRSLRRRGVLDLIASADAVLSLHRSEGFGLLAAEAMLIGVPVIATDWSGTTDFLTAETGIPVPYRLVPAIDPQRSYHFPRQSWADADVEAAAAALLRLRDDPAYRQELAQRGQAAARRMFSMDRYAAALKAAVGS